MLDIDSTDMPKISTLSPTTDPHLLSKQEKELKNFLRQLAHVHGLVGSVPEKEFHPKNDPTALFGLEGCKTNETFLPLILESLQYYTSQLSSPKKEIWIQVQHWFKKSTDLYMKFFMDLPSDQNKIAQEILNLSTQEPVLFPTGWEGNHEIAFVLHKDELRKINRGAERNEEHGIEIFKIQSLQSLDAQLMVQLISTRPLQTQSSFIESDFIQKTLPKTLNLKKIGGRPKHKQRAGTCARTNPETGIQELLEIALAKKKLDITQAKKMYTHYTHWNKNRSLKVYESFYADEKNQEKFKTPLSRVFCKLYIRHHRKVDQKEKTFILDFFVKNMSLELFGILNEELSIPNFEQHRDLIRSRFFCKLYLRCHDQIPSNLHTHMKDFFDENMDDGILQNLFKELNQPSISAQSRFHFIKSFIFPNQTLYCNDRKLDVDLKDQSLQFGLIHIAAMKDSGAFICYLLQYGADLNLLSTEGQSALHMAVQSNAFKAAETLLRESKINLNQQDCQGYTPLMYAIESGNCKIVELLLSYHPFLEIKNNRGENAFKIAKKMKSKTLVDKLKQARKTQKKDRFKCIDKKDFLRLPSFRSFISKLDPFPKTKIKCKRKKIDPAKKGLMVSH